MTIVSQSLPSPEWIFPSITNNYEARLAGRKRSHDADYEGQKQERVDMYTKCSNKKAKTTESLQSVSNAPDACLDARAPHEFLAGAGDWKFEPLAERDVLLDEEIDRPAEPVDVERVIAILLDALNSSNQRSESPEPPARSNHTHPTSPLSNSPHRSPLVRKAVGGGCRGRVDTGLQRWVLCKNHVEDVRAYHPSFRSSEWIEALHEMGWEHLHPTYASQSQQTFKTLDTFSKSFDDWIDVDASEEYSNLDGVERVEGDRVESLHEEAWGLGMSVEVPPRRTTPLLLT